MSYAITAPKKFEFQDLVCTELGLRVLSLQGATLVGEPKGGEDGRLTLPGATGTEQWRVEIQVKGAIGTFDVALLTEFLVHFPAYKSKDTLIERLVSDTRLSALFSVSARAVDALQPLLLPPDWPIRELTEKRAGNVDSLVQDIQQELERIAAEAAKQISVASKPSPLDKKRSIHLQTVAKMSIDDLRRGIKKILIQDIQTTAGIEVRLQAILRESHRLPSDRLRDGIASLAKAVERSKDTQSDALDDFRSVLDELAPSSVVSSQYLVRGQEADLLERLSTIGTVYLSGPPRAGKTWTARWLAAQLQKQGFEVRVGNDVGEADRYLTDPTKRERAFLLDDPLGDRMLSSKASEIVASLDSLVKRLPSGRRLIVAQVQEPILSFYRRPTLAACGQGGIDWIALSDPGVDFASRLWSAACEQHNVPTAIRERVRGLISSDPSLREPGALNFLATQASAMSTHASAEEILMRAHMSATALGRELASSHSGMDELLIGLAIATDSVSAVQEADLAFVLDGEDERPGLRKHNYVAVTMGSGSASQGEPIPAYSRPHALSAGCRHLKTTLERHRFIDAKSATLNFTHPYFRAGAQQLVAPETSESITVTRAVTERAISCVKATTSKAAASNLSWIGSLAKDAGHSESIAIDLAVFGLRSIFPATRDTCFAYLMNNVTELTEEQKDEIPKWTNLVTAPLSELASFDGGAYILDGELGSDYFERVFGGPNEVEIKPFLDAIENGETLDLGLERSRYICRYLDSSADRITPTLCQHLLSSDLSAVRAVAVRSWLSRPRHCAVDVDIRQRVEHDRSPAVTVGALHGAAQSWKDSDSDRRQALLKLLVEHLGSAGSATAVFLELVLFDRVEKFGENPPWDLFAQVTPAAMDALPPSVNFDNGRLANVVERAIAAGKSTSLVPLFNSWAARLAMMETSEKHAPGGYDLYLVPHLIAATRENPQLRTPVLGQLMRLSNTGARMTIVADMVSEWEHLQDEERDRISQVLRGDSEDAIWLQAAALLRKPVPPGIQVAVPRIGGTSIEGLSAAATVRALGDDLASACLLLATKHYGVFSRIAIGGSQSPIGRKLIDWIGVQPEHPCFEPAFRWLYQERNLVAIRDVVGKVTDAKLNEFFSLMLDLKLDDDAGWARSAWCALLDRGGSTGLLENWLTQIREAAPVALCKLGEALEWLDKKYAMLLIKRLHEDYACILLAKELLDIADALPAKQAADYRQLLMAIAEKTPPLLEHSWDLVKRTLTALSAADSELKITEAHRLRAIENQQSTRDSLRAKFRTPTYPPGWSGH